MHPLSSSKAAQVPTAEGTTTNLLTLLVAGGSNANHIATDVALSNFTLRGTEQGHLYNGLRVGWSRGATLTDVLVQGIPGNSNANPGETFSVNLWHADGVTLTRVVVDGRAADGARVAASAFGFNNLDGATTVDCAAHFTRYGTGATHYKCSNIVHLRLDVSQNRRPINVERHSGLFHLIAPDLRGPDKLPHLTANTDGPSAQVVIEDPLLDAWPLRVGVLLDRPGKPALYMGRPQTQRVADVQLLVGGVDRSDDPAYLLCGNVW